MFTKYKAEDPLNVEIYRVNLYYCKREQALGLQKKQETQS